MTVFWKCILLLHCLDLADLESWQTEQPLKYSLTTYKNNQFLFPILLLLVPFWQSIVTGMVIGWGKIQSTFFSQQLWFWEEIGLGKVNYAQYTDSSISTQLPYTYKHREMLNMI